MIEVLPDFAGVEDSDTAEWAKVDVANQELVVKTRKFCDYALGELELEKTCTITVGDDWKMLGDEDPRTLATNFQARVTGKVNVSDFPGYAKRAKGEDEGEQIAPTNVAATWTRIDKDTIEDVPALIQAKVVAKSPAERIEFATDRLLKPNVTRPRTRKTLLSHVAAMFLKALPEEEVAVIVDGLFKSGCVRENGKRIEYLDETK